MEKQHYALSKKGKKIILQIKPMTTMEVILLFCLWFEFEVFAV